MANKQLGQNFLVDKNIINKIVESMELSPHSLEIGPGRGALTIPVLKLVNKLTVIELDKKLAQKFNHEKLEVIIGDCLKQNLNYETIFTSLPYNISSEFVIKLYTETIYKRCYLIVQLEFAERLYAKPHTKKYGALSVLAQLHADIHQLFTISNSCFLPVPQVQSTMISMIFKQNLDIDFVNFVFKCFTQRRKKLKNVINTSCEMRADQISPQEYVKIYQEYSHASKS